MGPLWVTYGALVYPLCFPLLVPCGSIIRNNITHCPFFTVLNGMYDSGRSEDTCGGRIVSNYGRITSPGFPSSYRPNLDCVWIVKASSARVIRFYFEYIDIDDTGHCGRDFVSLKDGDSRSSPSMGRYCGKRKPGN